MSYCNGLMTIVPVFTWKARPNNKLRAVFLFYLIVEGYGRGVGLKYQKKPHR